MITALVILGLLVVLVFYGVGIYNRLIELRNRFKNAFAQIEVQLTRRHDLIPNLVETAKGYLKHERETLEAVVEARSAAVNGLRNAKIDPSDPEAMKQLSGAESMLTQALSKLFALAEAYPDLKANQNMMQLSEEITTTENRIAFARQGFNDAVMQFNTYRESFPNVILAGMFSFQPAEFLEIDDPAKREVPKVEF